MSIKEHITGLQHIGLPTENIKMTEQFYTSLGFTKLYGTTNKGDSVLFLEQKGLILECYETKKGAMKSGAWDHVAIDVDDIKKAFEEVKKLGYPILEGSIQSLPFFEKGVSYFTIEGPNKEKVEFNQKF